MVFSTTPITGKEARRMRYSNQGRFRQQVRFLRRQFLQDGNLPFTNVLSDRIVSQALTAAGAYWVDRIYSPLVTLWVFLGQVLSADHSCRAAVARLIAHRLSRGQRPCSAETGAYCQARKRLPEKFFSDVARHTGTRVRNQRRLSLAVETAPSLCLRWFDGDDARYAGKPAGLSATQGAAARPGLSTSAHRGSLFSRLWRRA